MATLDYPKLRPLSVRQHEQDGQSFAMIEDPQGAFPGAILLPLQVFLHAFRHFDGKNSLAVVQSQVFCETGQLIPAGAPERMVVELDNAMVLDGPTYASFKAEFGQSALRPAALAGRSYEASDPALRAQLYRYFSNVHGAGPPALGGAPQSRRIRGVISPHIDFTRGGPVSSWSYKEQGERTEIDTFVILGVAHQYCRRRFALTLKDFKTPLGIVRTDRNYVERLVQIAGADLFDDGLLHRAEHSIELQVVFLQYVLGKDRNFSIVPILVGSFQDHVERGADPIDDPEIRRFVDALRLAEEASGKKVVYIGGIDLCHVGPEFGDPEPVDVRMLEDVRRFDHEMLRHAAAGDAWTWFQTAAQVSNRWRVCGLAATYTMLHALGPADGRLMKYHQALDDRRSCCVSFASMVFHTSEPKAGADGEATDVNAES
jgi:AmmeMemoRadiSam system protein B